MKDHPKSKDFTQQFFLLRVLKFKRNTSKLTSWSHHSPLQVSLFLSRNPQISDKKLCNFKQFTTQKPFEIPIFLFSPIFHRIKNMKKIHSKQTFVKNFPKGKNLQERLPETKPESENYPPKIGSQILGRTFHRLANPVPRVKLRVFAPCGRDNHINLHMSYVLPPKSIEKRTSMTLKAIFFFAAPTLTFLIIFDPSLLQPDD